MNTHKDKIILRDPTELKVHPALKHVPEWSNDDPDFLALVDDVRERGIDYPLIICGDQIVDGRHRWRAGKRLQLKLVPTIECTEAEVSSIILGTLLQRRHFSKGALAYLSFPLMQPAYEEAQQRKMDCLKQGKSRPALSAARAVKSVEELAEQIGVGERLFRQARELHQIFENKPKLRSQFEPKLLAGENGLGATLAGIAGQAKTKRSENGDKGKPEVDQLELFEESFDTLTTRLKYWKKFSEEERGEAKKKIVSTVKKMPPDLLDELESAIAAVKKQNSKEGK